MRSYFDFLSDGVELDWDNWARKSGEQWMGESRLIIRYHKRSVARRPGRRQQSLAQRYHFSLVSIIVIGLLSALRILYARSDLQLTLIVARPRVSIVSGEDSA